MVLYYLLRYADMAELADAPDLGSGVYDVQVQLLLSAPTLRLMTIVSSAFLFLKSSNLC